MPHQWPGLAAAFVLCFTRCAGDAQPGAAAELAAFPDGAAAGCGGGAGGAGDAVAGRPATPAVTAGCYGLLLVREVAVGAALGLGLWLLVTAGLAAGNLAQAGLGMSEEEEGPLATLLLLLILVFFVQLNGLPWLAGTLRKSYVLAPLGTSLPEASRWHEVIYWPGRMFATMLTLAAPLVLATVLASWLVASIQRCLPGLRAEQLGPAARHLAAILALVLVAPLLGAFVLGQMNAAAAAATQVLLRVGR